jgi:adenosylmethionine-8-amino-7-oxononanoate aminotransferase
VARESLRVFDEERCLERVGRLERVFGERLAALRHHPRVADVRGIGGMAAVALTGPGAPGYLSELGPRLQREALARDVLLRPLGNVVYLLPPYAISDEDAHRICDVLEAVVDAA